MAGVGQSGSGGAGLKSQSGAGVGIEYIFKCTTDDSSAPPQRTCQGRDSFRLAGLTIAWELTVLGSVNGCRPEGKMAQDGRRSPLPCSGQNSTASERVHGKCVPELLVAVRDSRACGLRGSKYPRKWGGSLPPRCAALGKRCWGGGQFSLRWHHH